MIAIEVYLNSVIRINRQTHIFVKKEALAAILSILLHPACCGNPARQHWDRFKYQRRCLAATSASDEKFTNNPMA
jgi:hypothetical protein